MYNLFLDDVRTPEQTANHMPPNVASLYRTQEWITVRDYESFVKVVEEQGVPSMVSFDHDLADIHYDPSTWTEGFEYHEKTGLDCAKWLLQHCQQNKLALPDVILVHSQNPVGRQNILNEFQWYNRKN